MPPPLTTEFLERSSFDLDDKVMEMTPQGYHNYSNNNNRKFSENLLANHHDATSPRNHISFAELRPRVHAMSNVAPVINSNNDLMQPYGSSAPLEF